MNWRSLIQTIENKLFSSSYVWLFLLPILMSLTKDLPNELKLPFDQSIEGISLNLVMPISWKLMYFCAVFLTLARVIYLYYCPKFLRDYKNAGEAIEKGVTAKMIYSDAGYFISHHYKKKNPPYFESVSLELLLTLIHPYDVERNILEKMKEKDGLDIGTHFIRLVSRIDIAQSLSKPGHYRVSDKTSENKFYIEKDELTKDVFWSYQGYLNFTSRTALRICTIFTATAITLLLLVFAQGFANVLGFDLGFLQTYWKN